MPAGHQPAWPSVRLVSQPAGRTPGAPARARSALGLTRLGSARLDSARLDSARPAALAAAPLARATLALPPAPC
jgi:hypothetical protein